MGHPGHILGQTTGCLLSATMIHTAICQTKVEPGEQFVTTNEQPIKHYSDIFFFNVIFVDVVIVVVVVGFNIIVVVVLMTIIINIIIIIIPEVFSPHLLEPRGPQEKLGVRWANQHTEPSTLRLID